MSYGTTFHDIARRMVLRLIAREHGHLSDSEAQDWISLLELEAA